MGFKLTVVSDTKERLVEALKNISKVIANDKKNVSGYNGHTAWDLEEE